MGEREAALTNYRLRLCRDDVLRLKERAARESREVGKEMTWQQYVRAAVKAAAAGGEAQK